jgi:glucosyl-dolichyl phosphate glucuronosyltransferase
MYKLSDISVIIPTYNRPDDVKETLKHLLKFSKEIPEILIIDQSNNNKIKDLIKSLKNKKIKYFYTEPPSLTRARNFGIKNANKKSKIICFLDDDVNIEENYFNEILNVFNNYPDALGVGAFDTNSPKNVSRIEKFIKKVFFLRYYGNDARVLSVYGNCYPRELKENIFPQWMPGVNMVYKKEIFNEQTFDENFTGYSLAEDFDFTYRLFKNHPNSLVITPFAKLLHRASSIERYPTKKINYSNTINHFYLNYKNFNSNIRERVIFIWSIFGIGLLRIFGVLKSLKKVDFLKLKFYFSSLIFVYKNRKEIRNGKINYQIDEQ